MNVVATKGEDDVRVDGCGGIVMLTPMTARARRWVEKRVSFEPWQVQGASVVIDHRYAEDIARAMRRRGFVVGRQGGRVQGGHPDD
jgi:hypothetical protein